MLKEFEGQMPKIDKKAHAFESADLIGKVEMKEYSRHGSMLLFAAMLIV